MKNQIGIQKIVIIGPRTDIGKCILGHLAQHAFPVTAIRALDIHQEAGKSIYYSNHRLITQALDSFDFHGNHIVFVCDKKLIPLLYQHNKNLQSWWIDCTHFVHDAVCVIPEINGTILQSHPKWICNPCSCVIALLHTLMPIVTTYKVQSIELVALLGTVFQGPEATAMLMSQIRHCLIQTPIATRDPSPQLAFNVIPNYFRTLSNIIERQIHCFITTPVLVRTCFVPVVRGSCTYVQVHLSKNCRVQRLIQKWKKIPYIQVIQETSMLGLNEILAEEKIFILQPVIQNNILSFWCMQDVVQQGMGTNAAALAKSLYEISA